MRRFRKDKKELLCKKYDEAIHGGQVFSHGKLGRTEGGYKARYR